VDGGDVDVAATEALLDSLTDAFAREGNTDFLVAFLLNPKDLAFGTRLLDTFFAAFAFDLILVAIR